MTTMTDHDLEQLVAPDATEKPKPIEKVSIIVSKGSLEGIYPALIMANGARNEGIEANLFFTFFGMDAIHKQRHDHIKVATVGNPGLHIPTWAGGLPGVSALMTKYMEKQIEKLDFPGITEFIEMIHDTGAGLYACLASVDLFGMERDVYFQVAMLTTVGLSSKNAILIIDDANYYCSICSWK